MATDNTAEPFPTITPTTSNATGRNERPQLAALQQLSASADSTTRTRKSRGSSIVQSFLDSNPPLGMWAATGEVGSKIPTLPEIRNGSFAAEGWSHEGQLEQRGANPHDIHRRRLSRTSSGNNFRRPSEPNSPVPASPSWEEGRQSPFPTRGSISKQRISEEPHAHKLDETLINEQSESSSSTQAGGTSRVQSGPDETGTYPNGYRFPKKHTWGQATVIGLKAFWRFLITPFGFLITLYGLNVVGWGAMIFFVLLNAAPAMCKPTCNDINSPRKIWIEIDSQVLNALFCVTGFGLIPWRFRDFYWLVRWRVMKDITGHRRLAGIYRSWYRLPGSDQLPEDIGPPPVYSKKNPQTAESPPPFTEEEIARLEANVAIPLPVTSMAEPPLTGVRAPPSRSWTLDGIIWLYMANTFLQGALCYFMWGYNRYNRPSWGVGLFITLGCFTGIFAGIITFIEGRKVKRAEGIPVQEYDVLESTEDFQERKMKEGKKEQKKVDKQLGKEDKRTEKDQGEVRVHKVKGKQWFTRH